MKRTHIELADFMRYTSLTDLQASGEGRYLAFLAVRCDGAKNGYAKTIWIYETGLGILKELYAPCVVNAFVWDGLEILLISDRQNKNTRFVRLNAETGDWKEAFTLPAKIDKILPLGKGRYAVIAEQDLAEDDELLHVDYEIFEDLPLRQNAGGYVSRIRKGVYLAEPEINSFEKISLDFFDAEALSVIPGGRFLAYAGREYRDMKMLNHSINLYDLESGEKIPVLKKEDGFFFGFMAGDDEDLIYTATDMKPHGFGQNKHFYCYNFSTRRKKLIAPYDRNSGTTDVITDVRYAPSSLFCMYEGDVYFGTTERYKGRVKRCGKDGGITEVIAVEGDISGFVFAGKDLYYIAQDGLRLPELYRASAADGKGERITSFNEAIYNGKTIRKPEHFIFTNKDGIDLDGWVITPEGYKEGKKYPAILDIHGGPRLVYGGIFVHEMQYWANQGYFVIFSNPRGSSGRGDDFTDMFLEHKLGEWDFNDLMDFTDAALKRYPAIDPECVGVTGGSYGGFMTNWILGHTKRFAAAVSQRSISDWFSNTLVSDNGYFDWNRLAEKDVWTEYDRLWAQSPVRYAPSVATPALFIHSFEDYRCPFEQGLEMFTALKMNGVETRLVAFYQETHELSRTGKPSNRVKRLLEITRWFDTHLKSKEK
jgi:dipeptidyl aminopeptidase/acylaminoacyl peptidase